MNRFPKIVVLENECDSDFLAWLFGQLGLDSAECEHGFSPIESCPNEKCNHRTALALYKRIAKAGERS